MVTCNPPSTANVGGHPIHPMLVYFPIAFFVGALVTDLISRGSSSPEGWALGSYYLIGAGLIMAVFTALAGITDFAGSAQIRALREAWWHAGANVLVVVLEAISWYLRHKGGTAMVSGAELGLSVVSTLLLLFSGWMGGELVFRHRVAVMDEDVTKAR
jgi:uncharacterized membrane protein